MVKFFFVDMIFFPLASFIWLPSFEVLFLTFFFFLNDVIEYSVTLLVYCCVARLARCMCLGLIIFIEENLAGNLFISMALILT